MPFSGIPLGLIVAVTQIDVSSIAQQVHSKRLGIGRVIKILDTVEPVKVLLRIFYHLSG